MELTFEAFFPARETPLQPAWLLRCSESLG